MIALRAYARLKHPGSSYGLTPSPTLIRLSLLIIIIVDYCLNDDKNKTIGRNICYNEKKQTFYRKIRALAKIPNTGRYLYPSVDVFERIPVVPEIL